MQVTKLEVICPGCVHCGSRHGVVVNAGGAVTPGLSPSGAR